MRSLLLALLLTSQALAAPVGWELWQGDQAFRRGDYKSAITHYQAAGAHYNLGLAYARSKQLKEARAEWEKALEGEDLSLRGKAAYNLGNLDYRENKLEEALKHYKTALRYDELDEDARHNAWIVMQKLKAKEANKPKGKEQEKPQRNAQGESPEGQKGEQDKKPEDPSKGEGEGKEPEKQRQDPGDKPQDPKDQQGQKEPPKQGQGDKPKEQQQDKQPGVQRFDPAQARRQQAEQLLRYFEEKERNENAQRAQAIAPRYLPSQGGQTW